MGHVFYIQKYLFWNWKKTFQNVLNKHHFKSFMHLVQKKPSSVVQIWRQSPFQQFGCRNFMYRNFSWHVHPGVERWWHQLTVLTVTDWLRMNAEPDVVSLIPFPQLCMGMRPWTRAGCCEWDRERSGGHRLHVLTRASRRWRGCWFHDMEIDNRCLMPNQSYSCQP